MDKIERSKEEIKKELELAKQKAEQLEKELLESVNNLEDNVVEEKDAIIEELNDVTDNIKEEYEYEKEIGFDLDKQVLVLKLSAIAIAIFTIFVHGDNVIDAYQAFGFSILSPFGNAVTDMSTFFMSLGATTGLIFELLLIFTLYKWIRDKFILDIPSKFGMIFIYGLLIIGSWFMVSFFKGILSAEIVSIAISIVQNIITNVDIEALVKSIENAINNFGNGGVLDLISTLLEIGLRFR